MGQTRTSSLGAARPLPPSADIDTGGQSVGQAAQFCLVTMDSAPPLIQVRDEHTGGIIHKKPVHALNVATRWHN